MLDDRKNRSAPMMATVVACPVCRKRLASTEAACSECGAILALRAPDTRRRLAKAVKPHITHVYRRTRSIVTAAFAALAQHGRAVVAVAALAVTVVMFAVLVAAVFGPRNTSAPRVATTTGEVRPTDRTAPGTEPLSPAAPISRHRSASPPTPRPAVGLQNPMALAVAATIIGAIVGTIAVVSRRRRVPRLAWVVNSAAVVAAFCFGLAAALLVVATVEHQRTFASAVPAGGDEPSGDAWRREASTLKEALTVIDARLASLESTHGAGDSPTRSQSVRPRSPAEGDELRAVTATSTPSRDEAVGKPPTADILRPPRVAATSLGERVWSDIVRDWERVRRTVRDLVRPD